MQIEFLGSGGAVTIPRPGCTCRICDEARQKGRPYSRTGPSLFVHGPNLLIDTPEEIKDQLNRALIRKVDACFYSHWHPDHVLGCRVWEMNMDISRWPPENKKTNIYFPQQVAQDLRTRSGLWEQFTYLERLDLVHLVELSDGDGVSLGACRIRPFRVAEDYMYAFLLEANHKRVLIILDELFGWTPPPDIRGVDLAILPMGLAEFDPLTGRRLIAADHPVLKREATFRQTLEVVRQLNAGRVVLGHIEKVTGLGYDDYLILEQRLQKKGFNITFAFDGMLIEI